MCTGTVQLPLRRMIHHYPHEIPYCAGKGKEEAGGSGAATGLLWVAASAC
nr:hypothetical protein [Candidatus Electrothrix aestuarii]